MEKTIKQKPIYKEETLLKDKGRPRQANLELLRCLAMMMVIVLHFLGKGKLLTELNQDRLGAAGITAWLLESFCIVAVNVYMFISGYFLSTSRFKCSRLIQLYLQLWFYSVFFGLLGAFTGVLSQTVFDTHYLLTLLLPVSMGHYWFLTAYFFLYLLHPFLNKALKTMTKEQLQVAVGLLFAVFCLLKSVLPVRLEMDGMGYDCIWYLCVYVSAAYVRRFGFPFWQEADRKKRAAGGLALYTGCCLLIFAGTMGLHFFYLKTGSLGRMLTVLLEYNHILPFLASVGLFLAFSQIRFQGKLADFVVKIAPFTLGVYLLHENIGFRYSWQSWFGAEKISSVGGLLAGTLLAVIVVFSCGILADMLRKWCMGALHRLLGGNRGYCAVVEKINRVDALFLEEKDENTAR